MRILLIWFVGFSSFQGTQATNYCTTHTPVAHVCVDSNATSTTQGVYVNSGRSPKLQAAECKCTITPDTLKQISLHLQAIDIGSDAANFKFKVQNLTINYSISTLNFSQETELVYTSSVDSIGGTCLWIGPITDEDVFSVRCSRIQTHSTTKVTKLSTDQNTIHPGSKQTPLTDETKLTNVSSFKPETTTVSVDQQTDKTGRTKQPDNGTKTSEIAAITGGIVGITVIVLTIISIVVYKRYRRIVIGRDNTQRRDGDDYCNMQINQTCEHLYDGLQMTPAEHEDRITGQ